MAQQHQLNGSNINYIESANWVDEMVNDFLNGTRGRHRYRRHTWQTEIMPVSEFDTLFALEGQKVSLTTTSYSDRNGDYLTYYGAEFRRITARHVSKNMQSLQCEFLVRL